MAPDPEGVLPVLPDRQNAVAAQTIRSRVRVELPVLESGEAPQGPEHACGSEDGLTATITVASGSVTSSIKSKTSKPRGSASIYGSGFSTNAKSNAVYFGTWKAKSTSLKVKIPKKVPKGIVGVLVVVGGKTSNAVPFVVK